MSLQNNKTILITGSSGMLGKDIFKEFLLHDYNVFGIDLVKTNLLPDKVQFVGDLTDDDFLASVLSNINPDIIIHCAAIVSLNICEENKSLANAIHVDVTRQLANFNKGNTKIIYISTDSIFDGEKGNYTENDLPNPLNYYAKSKLLGEKEALHNPNHIIIRTNIFGFNIPLRNSLAEWILKNLESDNKINGFTDVIFNAIYTKHLARIILHLISIDFKGLINIASQNNISKYQFAKKMASELGYDENMINKSSVDEMNFLIKRPKNTCLNVNKLKKLTYVPYIEDGIKEMIKNDKSHENY